MFSKGVFLNTIPKNKKHWEKQASFINSLPGVEHVEVWMEENLSLSEIRFIKSILTKYKIIVHAPFIELNFISCHPEIRKIALKLCLRATKAARNLGAKVVTLHGGKRNIFQSKETAVKLLAQNLKMIKNYQKDGPRIAIENLPLPGGVFSNLLSTFEDFSYLKKAFPGVYFTLDMGHAFQSGEDLNKILKFLKRYRDSVLDIHLHDAILRGKAHLALGKGDLDLMRFLKFLHKINYKNYLTLETITPKNTKISWQKLLTIEKRLNK